MLEGYRSCNHDNYSSQPYFGAGGFGELLPRQRQYYGIVQINAHPCQVSFGMGAGWSGLDEGALFFTHATIVHSLDALCGILENVVDLTRAIKQQFVRYPPGNSRILVCCELNGAQFHRCGNRNNANPAQRESCLGDVDKTHLA